MWLISLCHVTMMFLFRMYLGWTSSLLSMEIEMFLFLWWVQCLASIFFLYLLSTHVTLSVVSSHYQLLSCRFPLTGMGIICWYKLGIRWKLSFIRWFVLHPLIVILYPLMVDLFFIRWQLSSCIQSYKV